MNTVNQMSFSIVVTHIPMWVHCIFSLHIIFITICLL